MTYIQDIYRTFYDALDGNEALVSCLGSWVVLNGAFWGFNCVLLYCDVTGKPQWLRKYKVQPTENNPIDEAKLSKAIKWVIFYVVILTGLLGYPMYLQQQWLGISFKVDEVPSNLRILIDLACNIALQEVFFYYSHRMLHHPVLYKHVHKMHHEWAAPIGLVSVYAHPAEYAVSNGFSVLTGPLLLRCHIVSWFVWYIGINLITIVHHSGYHLPFLPSPEFHDYHHYKFRGNYGTWGLLDWMHGTDIPFRNTIQKKRNHPLLSFTPIRQLIPDTKKNE